LAPFWLSLPKHINVNSCARSMGSQDCLLAQSCCVSGTLCVFFYVC
jgi:hypothetical protein